MKYWKHLLIAAGLAFSVASVEAAQVTLIWDQAVIPAGDPNPDGARAFCTRTKPYAATPNATVAWPATTVTLQLGNDVVAVPWTCVVRYYRGTVEGPDSNEVSFTVPAVPLPKPQNLRITVNVTMNSAGQQVAQVTVEPMEAVSVVRLDAPEAPEPHHPPAEPKAAAEAPIVVRIPGPVLAFN